MSKVPADAPPAYSRVDPKSAGYDPSPSHPRQNRNGIPPEHRRSMEDEVRPLPPGWQRQFDAKANHQFFVDTKANPPRSIWHHPYDDQQYLETLPSAERERIQEMTRHSSFHDIVAEDSDDDHHHGSSGASSSKTGELPPRPDNKEAGKAKGWGRRMKDKMTNSTHEQREAERQKRADDEKKAYERHLALRQAMLRAEETGQPQSVGHDAEGKEVFIEPSNQYGSLGYGSSPYGQRSYSRNPNARYIRPADPYSRPYGRGYGGGYGLPIVGGLAGGLLLGDLMYGGMGMGMGGMGMGMGMGGMGMGMGGMGMGGMGGMGGGGM